MGSESLRRRLERLAPLAGDFTRLRACIHRVLRSEVPYDVGALSTLDPATLLWTSCLLVGTDEDPARERQLFALEFEGDDVNRYRDLADREIPCGSLLDATDGVPERSSRYRELLAGLGMTDELRLVGRIGGQSWGALTAYRKNGVPFAVRDVRTLGAESETIAALLRLALLHASARHADPVADGPGLLVLDEGGGVSASTSAAAGWLGLLDDRGRIPSVVHAVAASARVNDSYASARVPVGGGRWVVIHAAPIKDEGGLHDGAVSIILEEERRARLADVIAAAYGLTPRECDIVAQVARGQPNKRIAANLGISGYTVQDHLKAVFTKLGVGSRGELVAVLQDDHYAARFDAHLVPDAYGWYLDATV